MKNRRPSIPVVRDIWSRGEEEGRSGRDLCPFSVLSLSLCVDIDCGSVGRDDIETLITKPPRFLLVPNLLNSIFLNPSYFPLKMLSWYRTIMGMNHQILTRIWLLKCSFTTHIERFTIKFIKSSSIALKL